MTSTMDGEYFGRWRRQKSTRPLPRQQQRVFDFCRAEFEVNRNFPTKRMIADHMGWKNESGANDVLNVLVGKRYLDRRSVKGGWAYSLRSDDAESEGALA